MKTSDLMTIGIVAIILIALIYFFKLIMDGFKGISNLVDGIITNVKTASLIASTPIADVRTDKIKEFLATMEPETVARPITAWTPIHMSEWFRKSAIEELEKRGITDVTSFVFGEGWREGNLEE